MPDESLKKSSVFFLESLHLISGLFQLSVLALKLSPCLIEVIFESISRIQYLLGLFLLLLQLALKLLYQLVLLLNL